MKRLIVSVLFLGAVFVVGAERNASAESTLVPSEVVPLDAQSCWNTCQTCQAQCNDKPAGSDRDRCKEACSSSAVGCCVASGRKPPNYFTCTCRM